MNSSLNNYSKKLGIIVPTYKEKDNIENLLNRIKTEVEKYSIPTIVQIMDDSSPDGTADIVNGLIPKLNSELLEVRIKVRPGKMGLASAYTQGFELLRKDCQYLCEMDADLSHQPEYLHVFIAKMDAGMDLVIGSRYVKGGGVENWGIHRKLISNGGSIYCQAILGIPIHDWTGGYNMYRSTVFDTIRIDKIVAEGYLFQVELKFKTVKSGFKWSESPIIFPDRSAGHSKFDKSIMLEAMTGVWKLKNLEI